ncbi:MAG: DegV family EDD domain-containing protein [Gemmatimonadota bacterium]|nr:DegV family EDD domain-containing protein [Gemmatimonadota bacterium]
MTPAPVGIAYLDGPRLRRSLIAAADWVDAGREELNRINVFPVPDGDTGTNFAMTLRAVAVSVRQLDERASLPEVTRAMADACVLAARGNSGMLLSQFLLGFRDALRGRATATAQDVATAIRAGATQLSDSLDEPVEGTILTVSRDVAEAAERAASESHDFSDLIRRTLDRGQASLEHTPELLATLKESGVVDAGGKAFVLVLEGIQRFVEGDPIVPVEHPPDYAVPDAAALAEVATDRDFRYCTEVLVRGTALPAATEVRTALRTLGGSIVVLATSDLLKVHVHTNTPDEVYALAGGWGVIETQKADDMREQHRALHERARAIAIVVDSSCDLPDEVLDRHGIVMVPIQVIEGEKTYLDRVGIDRGELYRRMQGGTIFTTSQPTPAAFIQGYEDALSAAPAVLAILLAKSLSGTFASGQAAAKALGAPITLVDSRSASLGLGLLALRGAELADEGWTVDAIAAELQRIRDQSGGFFTVDTFENLLRSGRVGRGRAWIGTLLDVKPILEVGPDGRVLPLDKVRGREALIPRVLRHLEKRLTPRPARLRLGIVHAHAPDIAQRLQADLETRFAPRDCFVSDVTAALGVHTGPGAWGIFYQIEDPAPSA